MPDTIAEFSALVSRRIGRVLRDADKRSIPRGERSASLRSLLEDLTSGLEPAVIKHIQAGSSASSTKPEPESPPVPPSPSSSTSGTPLGSATDISGGGEITGGGVDISGSAPNDTHSENGAKIGSETDDDDVQDQDQDHDQDHEDQEERDTRDGDGSSSGGDGDDDASVERRMGARSESENRGGGAFSESENGVDTVFGGQGAEGGGGDGDDGDAAWGGLDVRRARYYELMARFYEQRPGEARSVHAVMVRLWSDPHTPAIYALLLHRWLYLSQQDPEEASHPSLDCPVSGPWTSRYFNVLLKGAGKLFRLDTARGSYDYASVFGFLRDGVCLRPEVVRRLKAPTVRMSLALVFRFFFYYDRSEEALAFLRGVARGLETVEASSPLCPDVEDILRAGPARSRPGGARPGREMPSRPEAGGGWGASLTDSETRATSARVPASVFVTGSHGGGGSVADPNGSTTDGAVTDIEELRAGARVSRSMGRNGASDDTDGDNAIGSGGGRENGSDVDVVDTHGTTSDTADDFASFSAPRRYGDGAAYGTPGHPDSAMGMLCDLLIRASTRGLRGLTHESVLIAHLLSFTRCPEVVARASPLTRNLLQSTLHSLQTPGGPMYPTRSVRFTARRAMDTLFPAGSWTRRAVQMLFRLAHPYYLLGSLREHTLVLGDAIGRWWRSTAARLLLPRPWGAE